MVLFTILCSVSDLYHKDKYRQYASYLNNKKEKIIINSLYRKIARYFRSNQSEFITYVA